MTRQTFTEALESRLKPIIEAGAAKGQSPQTAVQYVTGDYRALDSMRKKARALDEKMALAEARHAAQAGGE